MTSIKVKFRAKATKTDEGTIYYQIIHRRRTIQLSSGFVIKPCEWDATHSTVRHHTSDTNRSQMLSRLSDAITQDVTRLYQTVRSLELTGISFTADDIALRFKRHKQDYTWISFMENIISKLANNGQPRTSETYTSALGSFSKFLSFQSECGLLPCQPEFIMPDNIMPDLIEAYGGWLKSRGAIPNTVSFYMRILRAVYNRAVELGLTQQRNPFRRVYTGVDRTIKRALPLTAISRIRGLDLSACPRLDYARDMFMMSFYLRGMSFIDMAFLKKSDLLDGRIIYRRRKTGQQLTILWTREMQQIIDKYSTSTGAYLLPIIPPEATDRRRIYRNRTYTINRNLKTVARMAGISIQLSLYAARHSWASAARTKGGPISVISEGMGHDSETTTQIYLATLDTSAVDNANSLIIASL